MWDILMWISGNLPLQTAAISDSQRQRKNDFDWSTVPRKMKICESTCSLALLTEDVYVLNIVFVSTWQQTVFHFPSRTCKSSPAQQSEISGAVIGIWDGHKKMFSVQGIRGAQPSLPAAVFGVWTWDTVTSTRHRHGARITQVSSCLHLEINIKIVVFSKFRIFSNIDHTLISSSLHHERWQQN